jgi:hypothetical protein
MPQNGDMAMAKLIVIRTNAQPQREKKYPQTWLLYKHDNTIQLHVRHDRHNCPVVVDKGAA